MSKETQTKQTIRKISTTTMLLIAHKRKLASILNAVLIFFDYDWDDIKAEEFKSLTKDAEATSKGLCEAIRRDLKATGFDPWPHKDDENA